MNRQNRLSSMPTTAAVVALASCFICGGCQSLETSISIPPAAMQAALDAMVPYSAEKQLPDGSQITLRVNSVAIDLPTGRDVIQIQLRSEVTLPEKPEILERVARIATPPTPPGFPGRGKLPRLGSEPVPADPTRSDESTPTGFEELPPRTASGQIDLETGLRFDAAEGAFYCRDAQVIDIQFGDLPEHLLEAVGKVSEKVVNEYCRQTAVYRLDRDDRLQEVARSHLRSIEVVDGELMVRFGLVSSASEP
ncbi:MAG: DUF1439 domain-containing protein [Planctomycetota bacterium]